MNPFDIVSQHLNNGYRHTAASDALALLAPVWAGEDIPSGVAKQVILDRLANEDQTPLVEAMTRVVNQMPGLDYVYTAPA